MAETAKFNGSIQAIFSLSKLHEVVANFAEEHHLLCSMAGHSSGDISKLHKAGGALLATDQLELPETSSICKEATDLCFVDSVACFRQATRMSSVILPCNTENAKPAGCLPAAAGAATSSGTAQSKAYC